ncbi:nuclear body protein SP140-like protein isoform X1 [Salvelinus sp. IW2-2015]|uniref:nuclear body protein SP140-like protein isoform X1 n=1 Tax=Salvelinus sp. IW2-2015 TaxID=2691554 RepID=UPI000CEB0CBA|nr:nuclear body protein SP140-like protein isoform X1 [Salvelinus alpinus]
MDIFNFLTDEQLLRFFRCSRAEMLCMEQPHTFLNQVRDHHLIPEEMYKQAVNSANNVSALRMIKGVYKVLDWLETERPHSIKLFWSCVFRDHLLQQYPTLRNSLLDGSFTFNTKLPENLKKEEEEKEEKGRKVEGEEKEEEKKTGRKKRKQKISESAKKEEQPSTSTQSTPSQKRMVQKPTYVSGRKSTHKSQRSVVPVELPIPVELLVELPVTCGDKEGMLNRDKLAKGESCILVQGHWLTPSRFEEFGGKKSRKNWKYSVRCRDTTLGKLIQEGHLTSPDFKRRKSAQAKKAPFPSNQSANSITDSKPEEDDDDDAFEDEEEEAEQERQKMQGGKRANTAGGESSAGRSHGVVEKSVFKVTCVAINGTLHKDRFASGLCGKSIRSEQRWMTPVEFVQEGSALADPSWKKDIHWDGKPLSVLIKSGLLEIHSVQCPCNLCSITTKDVHDQDNDDDCFICRSQGSLICCDECPRSFHQRCHLPNVDDAMLGDNIQWMCTYCVLRTSQPCHYPKQMTYQEALTCRISDHLLECQYLLLCLYHADEDHIFVKDPCINVRNYTSVIKTPIWLDRVVEKLQQNLYQSVRHFESDVLLIFTNCATFNRDNAEFRGMCESLKDLFKQEFKCTFSIQLQHLTTSNVQ